MKKFQILYFYFCILLLFYLFFYQNKSQKELLSNIKTSTKPLANKFIESPHGQLIHKMITKQEQEQQEQKEPQSTNYQDLSTNYRLYNTAYENIKFNNNGFCNQLFYKRYMYNPIPPATNSLHDLRNNTNFTNYPTKNFGIFWHSDIYGNYRDQRICKTENATKTNNANNASNNSTNNAN